MMRYARYAAAALFALLAVGFVALWVRSNRHIDAITWPRSNCRLEFRSTTGQLQFRSYHYRGPRSDFYYRAMRIRPNPDAPATPSFAYALRPLTWGLTLPHWFLAASSLGLAALFAFKRTWRYSLRTILVATTLLTGLLGWAV
jgi:hypothetical protein